MAIKLAKFSGEKLDWDKEKYYEIFKSEEKATNDQLESMKRQCDELKLKYQEMDRDKDRDREIISELRYCLSPLAMLIYNKDSDKFDWSMYGKSNRSYEEALAQLDKDFEAAKRHRCSKNYQQTFQFLVNEYNKLRSKA